MQKQDEEQNAPPVKPALEEFMRLNPPAHTKEEIKNYYSTSEVLSACNDIAYDEYLTEDLVLQILKGNQYDLITIGDLQRWVTK